MVEHSSAGSHPPRAPATSFTSATSASRMPDTPLPALTSAPAGPRTLAKTVKAFLSESTLVALYTSPRALHACERSIALRVRAMSAGRGGVVWRRMERKRDAPMRLRCAPAVDGVDDASAHGRKAQPHLRR